MLKSSHRLPASFRFTRPQTLRTPFFFVKYSPSSNITSRLGVVVSKRVSQKAVVRNRIKRLVHTQVSLHLPTFTQPKDMLFIMQPQASLGDEKSLVEAISKAVSSFMQ